MCLFWGACFQPTGEPSDQPAPPFSPPERPVVMALKSVWNSWKDDTREEKNGRAKAAWNKLASEERRRPESNLFPLLRITGRSQPLSLNGNQLGSAQTPLLGHSKWSEQRKTPAKTPRLLWATKPAWKFLGVPFKTIFERTYISIQWKYLIWCQAS